MLFLKNNPVLTKIIFGLAAAAAVLLVIRFVFGGNEDTWICRNDQWVKHGQPATPKPEATYP